jgi:hypothetical protein
VNRRRALLVAGAAGLVAIGATVVVFVATRDDGRPQARRARPVTTTVPKATIRTTTPVGDAVLEPVVGGGAIWLRLPDGLRRLDPSSGAVAASLPARYEPTRFGDGGLWSVTINRERHCETTPADWDEYSPYRVEKIEAATNAVAFGIDLPGTCRYWRDNRDPLPELVVGSGSVWVREPTGCRLFEIDASTGALVANSEVVGRLVAADADGPWIVTGPGPNGSSPSCAPGGTGTEMARLEPEGTLGRTFRLPGALGLGEVWIADDAAWVIYPGEANDAWALARLDTSTGAVRTTRISPGSVATGDGQVWFLGSFPTRGRPNPGLLGEIDPRTGAVKRRFQLDLGSSAWSSASAKIVAVSSDAVWIVTRTARREVEVIQVAT